MFPEVRMYQDQPSPMPRRLSEGGLASEAWVRIIRSPRLRFRALMTHDGWRRVQPDGASLSLVGFSANFAMTQFSEVGYRKQRTCNSKNTMFGRYAAPSKPC
jgi:hypothetical protein